MTNTDTMIEPAAEDKAGEVTETEEQLWQSIRDEFDGDDGEDQHDDKDNTDDDQSSFDDDDSNSEEGAEVSEPEDLQAQNDRLQHSLNSEKGRTQAGRKEIERLKTEVSEAHRARRTPEDEDRLKSSKDRLDVAKEEYGDVIGPLAETVEHLSQRFDDMSKIEQRDLDAKTERLNALKAAEEDIFEREHPDGYDIVGNNQDALAAWVHDQPSELRDIFARNKAEIVDGSEASYLIGMFKQSLLDASEDPAIDKTENRIAARRASQLNGARSTRAQSQQRVTSVPPKDSDNSAGHWDYFSRKEREKENRR